MKTAFIIHGAYGSPTENWFSWLKKQLEQRGYTVVVPQFPTPENQSLDTWMEVMKPHLDTITEETLLFGHSVGASFLLSLLERISVRVKATFFVAGFVGKLNNPTFDRINKTFAEKSFDWEKITSHVGQIVVFHADDDPYVPLKLAQAYAEPLGVEIILVKGGKHLNGSAGYEQFPLLLENVDYILG